MGTTERKYWNLWKWLGVVSTVRSRGLCREGKNWPKESSLTMWEKLNAGFY